MRRFRRTAARDDDYDPNRAAVSLYKDGRSAPLESLRLRRNENGARRRATKTGCRSAPLESLRLCRNENGARRRATKTGCRFAPFSFGGVAVAGATYDPFTFGIAAVAAAT